MVLSFKARGAAALRIDNDNKPALPLGRHRLGASVVKIDAVSKDQGLHGGREVWFHVFSNEVLDWPTVEKNLSDEQRADLVALGLNRKLHYYPHNPLPEEIEDHGYSFEEFWVWSEKRVK